MKKELNFNSTSGEISQNLVSNFTQNFNQNLELNFKQTSQISTQISPEISDKSTKKTDEISLRVGIISDSHHRSDVARSAMGFLKEKGINLLIHAGDIVEFSTLKDMQNLSIPYYAVLGNNDLHLAKFSKKFNLFKEPFSFEYLGLKFKLMHYPFYFDKSHDIQICGHTHYFFATTSNNKLFINSGEICGRKKPIFEFCYADIFKSKDGKISFEISRVFSRASEISWQEEILKKRV